MVERCSSLHPKHKSKMKKHLVLFKQLLWSPRRRNNRRLNYLTLMNTSWNKGQYPNNFIFNSKNSVYFSVLQMYFF